MKVISTLFLEFVIILIGIGALAVDILWLPGTASRYAAANPPIAHLLYPFLAYTYVLSIPFYVGLYQAFKLLVSIERDEAFSAPSVTALKTIKACAAAIVLMAALGVLFVFLFIDWNRAQVIAFGIYLAFAASVVATFAAVLQRLIQHAVDLKSENDLTV